ncbi:MAG: AMP-binding protein [Desulfohalobiaceae bacterium]|nr:AMP-binding protein [Desulfohalobiaceae bacterium]
MEKTTSRFWNPFTETLSRENMRAVQLKNLRSLLSHAKSTTAFYEHSLADIDPRDVSGWEDLGRLPLVEKEDLRKAQEGAGHFLFGDLLGVPPEEVTHFRQTSGTTGKPVYVPESWESWPWRVEIWCHILWMAGFRPGDRVFLPFGYNVYVAFWEGHYASEKLGCTVIPGGALSTRGRIEKLQEVRATALLNTPTYGIHMAEVAAEMGLAPRELGIRKMVCAGEPLPPATRSLLEELWGCDVYNHIGGTEPCAWGAMCPVKEGLHLLEPYFIVEILDLETKTREVDEGELGVAVVTPLGRRSFPMIRFNTKDIVRKGRAGCDCGRTSMKVQEVVGRDDDLRKIRGVLFTPVAVEELLRGEFSEVGEFRIEIERKGAMDSIGLRFETRATLDSSDIKRLKSRLASRLKVKTNLSFDLDHVEPGVLERFELKAKRCVDLR